MKTPLSKPACPPATAPSGPKRLRNVEELEAGIRRLRAEDAKLQ